MGTLATLARRSFLIGSAAVAGGVVFGVYKYHQARPNPLLDHLPEGATTLTPYLRIDAQGVTVIVPRAEMGQGVHTTLAALVAEELDLAWPSLRVEHGPASAAYHNSAVFQDALPFAATERGHLAEAARELMVVPARFVGMQITGGSSSVPDAFDKMRRAGAAARHALVQAAAQRWGVPASTLSTRDGEVLAADGRRLAYTTLAADAARIALPDDPPLKRRGAWRLLGRSLPRVDMVGKCTGTATFGIDVRLPSMLHATVKMSPRLGAPLRRVDDAQALALPGVIKVVQLPGGVGVIATNTWRAFEAARRVVCEWGDAPYPATSAAQRDTLRAAFNPEQQDSRFRDDGDVEAALAGAAVVAAEYAAPCLAHATMEPMNAVAWMRNDGTLEVWAGTQAPTQARADAAKVAGIAPERVQVHTQLMGGGFGRRSESDFIEQAVHLALAVKGQPVQLTWSREEDMTHDLYRPPALARCRGVVGQGTVLALDIQVASPSVLASQGQRTGIVLPGPDKLIVDGAYDPPYGIGHYRATGYRAAPLMPISFWRSVGNSFNGFFIESFIDELAAAAGVDPLAMRLGLLTDEPSRKVLAAAAQMSAWGTALPAGRGRGVAFHHSFGVPVAEVVEVTITPAGVRIDKVFVAADVGVALDPRNIEAQLQSGVIFGLSAAVHGEITFADGAVQQSNFHDQDALRMSQAPQIEVRVLEHGDRIRGVGEPGTPPAAPALANAIFQATGKRLRELPLKKGIDFV